MPERRAEVVAEHARLEDRGVDAVILAQRRDEVTALNELARDSAVAAERVQGPALTVDGKEYQAGDRVLCLTNDRANGVSNGARATVISVDVERQTLTLERGDHRQVVIDTTRYDAIDRGYAMTVHKAQGMTAEVALVVGSDGATRSGRTRRCPAAPRPLTTTPLPSRRSVTASASATRRHRCSPQRRGSCIPGNARCRRIRRSTTRSGMARPSENTQSRCPRLRARVGSPARRPCRPRCSRTWRARNAARGRPGDRSLVEQAPGTGLDQWLRETDAAEHPLEQLISYAGGVRPDGADLHLDREASAR